MHKRHNIVVMAVHTNKEDHACRELPILTLTLHTFNTTFIFNTERYILLFQKQFTTECYSTFAYTKYKQNVSLGFSGFLIIAIDY